MAPSRPHIDIGRNAIDRLAEYCRTLTTPSFTIVCDPNTHAALGARVEQALVAAGLKVKTIVLTGQEIVADERYIMRTLVQSPPGEQCYVAVGSGTLTDITRYASFRSRNPFISVPSAPSVDGFLSLGAALALEGVKETFPAQGPIALFADVPTLVAAPPALRAAGFGDVLGKYTCLADWALGHLLWDEPFDPAFDARVRDAIRRCEAVAEGVAANDEAAITALMEALVEVGLVMLEWGDSRPASGSEHHLSHFWEGELLRTGRHALLHGAKVGYGALLMARLYDRLRGLSAQEVEQLAAAAPAPDPDADRAQIRDVFGVIAPDVERIQRPFLEQTPEQVAQLRQRIVDHWPEIQAIAATVPDAEEIADKLQRAGAPVTWQAVGLVERDVPRALANGHYLRNRYTVVKLFRTLGLDHTQA